MKLNQQNLQPRGVSKQQARTKEQIIPAAAATFFLRLDLITTFYVPHEILRLGSKKEMVNLHHIRESLPKTIPS